MFKVLTFLLVFISFSIASDLYYYENGKKVYLTLSPDKTRAVDKSIQFYTTSTGQTVGVSDTILIKTKNNIDKAYLVNKYNIKFERELPNSSYLIRVDNISNTIDIANQLYNESNIIYAHPNFLRKKTNR